MKSAKAAPILKVQPQNVSQQPQAESVEKSKSDMPPEDALASNASQELSEASILEETEEMPIEKGYQSVPEQGVKLKKKRSNCPSNRCSKIFRGQSRSSPLSVSILAKLARQKSS